MDKRKVLDNRQGYEYEPTIEYLYRCINAGKLLDINVLKHSIEQIDNR